MSAEAATTGCSAILGAILLWATLASLTVLHGADPAIPDDRHRLCHRRRRRGLAALARGRAQPADADAGLPGTGRLRLVRLPRALFCRPRLAPPAEAQPDLLAVGAVHRAVLRPAARPPPAVGPRSWAPSRLWPRAPGWQSSAAKRATDARSSALPWRWAAHWCGRATPWPRGSSPRAQRKPRRVVPASRRRPPCAARVRELDRPAGPAAWAALAAPGRAGRRCLPAVGHRHEEGERPLLGVLSYAAPDLSTALLVVLGFAERRPGPWPRLRADGGRGRHCDPGEMTAGVGASPSQRPGLGTSACPGKGCLAWPMACVFYHAAHPSPRTPAGVDALG